MDTGENLLPRELLGAYLSGDVTPVERAAVERLLAGDGSAQAEVRELQSLLALLSLQRRSVSPALAAALRLRVEKACAAKCRDLEVDPQTLQPLVRFLKQGERPVSEKLERELAARLSAALPGAGIGGTVAQATARREEPLSGARRSSRRATVQTVRVYAVPRSPWRARLAWVGVAAAVLIALVLGLARRGIRGSPVREPEANTVVHNASHEAKPTAAAQDAAQVAHTRPGQIDERKMVHAAQPTVPVPKPTAPEKDVAQDVVEKTEPAQQPTRVVPEKVEQAVSLPPAPPAVEGTQPEVANRDVPQKRPDTNNTPPQTAPETIVSQIPPRPGGGNGSGVGTFVTAPQPPAPPPPVTVPTAPELGSAALVMATRDGNVQALTPDGKTLTLVENQAVPSGSQIITDQGRVGLRLPGGNMLWVNGGSSLTLNYSGQIASVVLNRGEIAYKAAPGAGSLAVTATSVEVKDAKAVDMKIEDNMAKVAVLDMQASVGVKGRPSAKVKSGTKASVSLTGLGQTHTEAIAGRPNSWTDDLFPMIPTNDKNPRGKNRTPRKKF